MKVLILAGGYGTRLSEETVSTPKPMVEIGGKPIVWHIMKHYSSFGFNEFVLLLGYKSYVFKEYFANYFLHQSDVTFNLATNEMKVHQNTSEPWTVTLLDTGLDTMTGGRILRAKEFVGDETFFLTYGDGLSDIAVDEELAFHRQHGKSATVTSVQPEGRFGAIDSDSAGLITSFTEKPAGDGAWINAGYFILEPKVFDYINEGDQTIWERAPLEKLASDGELYSHPHNGFWRCMDTLRDKQQLNALWNSGDAPWRSWK
ncbi:MAG: glucose-1-phosphate cytidylyltransferase [Planctomycetota bacterium]|jgi:glucose-1-phosphate cytidylyltransferase